jgi:PKD repeat protein
MALTMAGALVPLAASPALAVGAQQSTIAAEVPATTTPNVSNGLVYAIGQVGSKTFLGGTFTSATAPGSKVNPVTRKYVLAFSSATGAIDTGFAPVVDNQVQAFAPGPTPSTVYIGGLFANVNGVATKGIALLDINTGLAVPTFHSPTFNGAVFAIRQVGNHLILGGTFVRVNGVTHAGIVSIDPNTGALQTYTNIQLADHHNWTTGSTNSNAPVGIRRMDVTPDGTRLIAVGNFKHADGLLRDQIVNILLGPSSATVDPAWSTDGYSAPCYYWAYDTYVRDISISPDGSYFAVAATGGGDTSAVNIDGTRSLCDTVSRFEISASGADVKPTWVNHTGNDSFESIGISGPVIYAGGHQRWVNNSFGSDSAAAGALPRPGLVALDPANGLPFSWNPGRNPRGAGAYSVYVATNGVYIGSDTTFIGDNKYYRGRIAFFPLAGGKALPSNATGALPGKVYLTGAIPTKDQGNILYRVNAGGPTLPSIDNGPDWAADQTDPSTVRTSGSNSAGWSPVPTVNATVPATTPRAIFDSERWDPGSKNDGQEMHWNFAVTPNVPIEVRLFIANRCGCTSGVGQRVFDVALDGSTVLNHEDMVADVGDQVGTMKAYDITSPASGVVTLDFTHEVENPLVNGIEIVRTDQAPPNPGNPDVVLARGLSSGGAGTTATLPNPGSIAWGQVRGAFMVDGQVFYGLTDGKFYKRTFDGSTFGPATLIDPYDDPTWSSVQTGSGQTYQGVVPTLYGGEMQSVTGMFFTGGRLYYSLAGTTGLRYRYFTPESGVLGSEEFSAGGTVDFSNVAGIFLSGSTVYYASRADGNLHSVAFNSGAPDASTDAVVSGPALDGNDWRARGMFLQPVGTPTAAIVPSCTNLSCTFDGSASTAPGSSITSYAWNFGDGGTDSGATTSHAYVAAGTYTVTLTVTTEAGGTATATQQVKVAPAATPITFVDSATATGTTATESVTVPSGVAAGNGLVLIGTSPSTTALTAPAGWTLVSTTTNKSAMTSSVWSKVATGGDAGSTVSVGFGSAVHGTVQLLAYSGTSASGSVASATASATNTSTTNVTTAVVNGIAPGNWVLQYWSAKSSTITSITAPAAVTVRAAAGAAGSARINSVSGDPGAPVGGGGTAGGLTATTDVAASATIGWTIVIAAGP